MADTAGKTLPNPAHQENAMNTFLSRQLVNPPILLERRRSERYRIIHILAITGRGTGQVIDIGRDGLSFGCLYPHSFPETWSMDIIDAKGSHIQEIQVRKVWERKLGHPELSSRYELEVGVEFIDLTREQTDELDFLLGNLECLASSFHAHSRHACMPKPLKPFTGGSSIA